MTPKPLDQIGWRDHRAALWWLWLLYRKPMQFRDNLSSQKRWKALGTGLLLYLHGLPYMLLLIVAGRFLLFYFIGLKTLWQASTEFPNLLIWHGEQIVIGAISGIVIGILLGSWIGKEGGIADGIAIFTPVGIAAGVAIGTGVTIGVSITVGIIGGISHEMTFGIACSIGVAIASSIEAGTAPSIYGGIIGGFLFGIAFSIIVGFALGIEAGIDVGIAVGITFIFNLLRAYYWPLSWLWVWPKLKPKRYHYHPVAWDDLCSLPFPRLDQLLASYAEYAPEAGIMEINRLIEHYPSQRMPALRAQTRLIARKTGQETKLSQLDSIVANLPEGDKGFLKRIPKLRELIGEISQLQNRLDTQDRPFLREPTSALLCEKIKNFQNQIAGYPEPLSSEFRLAAANWLEIAEGEHQKSLRILNRQPNPQVFRAGDPVDRGKEAFVPRESVLGELDRQLTLSTGCPGLILYARRRMGKSTLLRNLDGFLPTSTRTVVVSMQNPDAFTTQADFLNLIAQELASVGAASAAQGRINSPLPASASTLPGFFKWLETCNANLRLSASRLLLAIDEYENIDEKLGQGVFSEDLLAALRESIQYHRHIIWAFAGSRSIEELTHAPWPSYLISARTVEIPPFSEAETRRLLTEPLRYSPLWEKDDPKRPRFEPGFWGDGGIDQIHKEAGGWPHLVQLLAETAVDLSNDREKNGIDAELLEQAIQKAVTLGDTVLRQLLKGEASEAEWAYINGFRRRATQPPPEDDGVYRGLRRRLLVEDAGYGQWRLRVPLMLRWLRERG